MADASASRIPSSREPGASVLAVARAVDAAVALCRHGVVRWASPRLLELLGDDRGPAAREALLGVPMDDLLGDGGHGLPGPDARGAVECRLRRGAGEGRRVVVVVSRGDPGPDGEPDEIWTLRDDTRLRTLEAELLRTSRALGEAQRELVALREVAERQAAEREELLTVLSHELRTPVTVISGYARLLLSGTAGELSDEQRKFLEESARSCRRLDAFIGDLVGASRSLEGGMPLQGEVHPLGPCIDEVRRLLSPLLAERGARLEVEVEPDASRARFDRSRIERVLTNLLVNAVRYGPPGGRIAIRARSLAAAGFRFVEVSVADQGPGVPEEDRDRIFEPYVRRDGGREAAGLGLGLAICRRIVEAHGGTITVRGRPEGGSTFAFTLPGAEDDVDRDAEPTETLEGTLRR